MLVCAHVIATARTRRDASPSQETAIMNFLDPLADTTAPRYAIESDDEDELNPQLPPSAARTVDVEIKCPNLTEGLPLVLATGDAGKMWAGGVGLGEQIGAVYLNKISVGMVFQVEGKANIVVSEATTSLPVWAMNAYAAAVLELFKPSRVTLLDAYAAPVYIANVSLPLSDAPVRYLQTQALITPQPWLEPFAPPNLLQSTSAAFLARLALTPDATPTSLFLLPSAHVARPRPTDLDRSTFSPTETEDWWDADIIAGVHELLLPGAAAWDASKGKVRQKAAAATRRALVDVGEGGMYI